MAIPDRWRRFAAGDDMSATRGAAVARGVFAAAFLTQVGFAAVVAAAAMLAGAAGDDGAPVLGAVLVALAAVQGPAGAAALTAPLGMVERPRAAALQRIVLAAVLFATPAWYLGFLVAVGGRGWPVWTIAGALGLYWFVGVLGAGRLGAGAAAASPGRSGRDGPASAPGSDLGSGRTEETDGCGATDADVATPSESGADGANGSIPDGGSDAPDDEQPARDRS